jgi:hypothetical protein
LAVADGNYEKEVHLSLHFLRGCRDS